jgi:archaellum component FlaF (FlaF/FlaG flagellin family)
METVTISNSDDIPPIVLLINIASGTRYPVTVIPKILPSVSDNIGVWKVEYYQDNAFVPYSIRYAGDSSFADSLNRFSPGHHVIRAVAYDFTGNSASVSADVVLYNPVDSTLPIVSFTTPNNKQSIRGADVPVSIAASDIMGIQRIRLFLDGDHLITSLHASPYSFPLDTATISVGSHTLTAEAWDTAGNSASATITITVNNGMKNRGT